MALHMRSPLWKGDLKFLIDEEPQAEQTVSLFWWFPKASKTIELHHSLHFLNNTLTHVQCILCEKMSAGTSSQHCHCCEGQIAFIPSTHYCFCQANNGQLLYYVKHCSLTYQHHAWVLVVMQLFVLWTIYNSHPCWLLCCFVLSHCTCTIV